MTTSALLLGAGCLSPTAAPCDSDDQCYADQICVDGACELGSRDGDGGGGGGGGADGGGGGGGGGDDAGEEVVACRMAPICASDDAYEKGGDFAHTIYAGESSLPAGCTQWRTGELDRVTNASLTGKLCRSDTRGDLYAISWSQCGAVAYTIRAELEITTPCSDDLYEVEFREDNCETGFFQCELEQIKAGHWVWTVTLPMNSNSQLSNNLVIDIEPSTREPIGLDYTLDVTTTQLTE
jgi:hypothetical protein